jgi:hypothetical protein
MYAAQSQEIWRWKPKDDTINKYTGFPEGFICHHPGRHFECELLPLGTTAVTEDFLYIVPMWGNQFLKLNKKTGEISQWDVPFKASTQAANGYMYTWGIGGFMWSAPQVASQQIKFIYLPTRKIYNVDVVNNIWEEVPLNFDDEIKMQMEIGFARMSKWFLYGCNESAFNTLIDFLNGTIHGKAFSREEQLTAFADIAVNNDGTAGEKIYEFVMERMTTT